MDRRLSSGAGIALAMIGIFSCSGSITDANGISSDDLTADASRIASVSVTFGSSSIAVGDTTRATATLLDYQNRPLYRTVTWSSSNSALATVSATGLITGVGPGTAVITASRGYKTGSATITVTAATSTGGSLPVASVSVSPATAAVQLGGTVQLTAVTRDANGNVLTGRAVTWSSASPAVATVSGSGSVANVATVAVGSDIIRATSETTTGTAAITVTPISTTGGNSPEPGLGDVILWQDNFNK